MNMSAFLYFVMICAWGFSWIAIKWQQGNIPVEVSIFYRFAIAACLMFIIGRVFRKLQPVSKQHHAFIALQGVLLFCFNFIAFYNVTIYIASGLTAVVMASAPIFNAINSRLIYNTTVSTNFWFGAVIGFAGISLLFLHDLAATQWSVDVIKGLLFSLLGTLCFSFGNMVSMRNSRHNIKPFTATSYGMLYGCFALILIILFKGYQFEMPDNARYLFSLFYLAGPATVIGFTVFLILVDRIGAHNAAYLLVITPIIALVVSGIFESYQWTNYSSVGLILVGIGNVITQLKKPVFQQRNQGAGAE